MTSPSRKSFSTSYAVIVAALIRKDVEQHPQLIPDEQLYGFDENNLKRASDFFRYMDYVATRYFRKVILPNYKIFAHRVNSLPRLLSAIFKRPIFKVLDFFLDNESTQNEIEDHLQIAYCVFRKDAGDPTYYTLQLEYRVHFLEEDRVRFDTLRAIFPGNDVADARRCPSWLHSLWVIMASSWILILDRIDDEDDDENAEDRGDASTKSWSLY